MSFAPKWARPAALIGLELNLAVAQHNAKLSSDEEFLAKLSDLEARIAMLPRD